LLLTSVPIAALPSLIDSVLCRSMALLADAVAFPRFAFAVQADAIA
jgi:hypothetical protein